MEVSLLRGNKVPHKYIKVLSVKIVRVKMLRTSKTTEHFLYLTKTYLYLKFM